MQTKFPTIASRVRETHELVGSTCRHHDFEHDLCVSYHARANALDEWGDPHTADLADVAGLVHSADRMLKALEELDHGKPTEETVIRMIRGWIGDDLSTPDADIVVTAVLRHDKPNADDDSHVQIALQDADRIVNMGLLTLIRAAQLFHGLPPVDYQFFLSNPQATYRAPLSVLRDFMFGLDWATEWSPVYVRTRRARRLVPGRAAAMKEAAALMKTQMEQDGIQFAP